MINWSNFFANWHTDQRNLRMNFQGTTICLRWLKRWPVRILASLSISSVCSYSEKEPSTGSITMISKHSSLKSKSTKFLPTPYLACKSLDSALIAAEGSPRSNSRAKSRKRAQILPPILLSPPRHSSSSPQMATTMRSEKLKKTSRHQQIKKLLQTQMMTVMRKKSKREVVWMPFLIAQAVRAGTQPRSSSL